MAKKKMKLKRKLPLFLFSLMMVAVFFTGYVVAKEFLFPTPPGLEDVPTVTDEDGNEIPQLDRLNFLVLGMDARKDEKMARTDTMIFVSVDQETNRIAMMSIPRDTRVKIPGHGTDKINSANVYGGPELASKTVSNLLGVPIDYYVLARFEGFKDVVDAVGGLDFEVQQNMYYHDASDGTLINLKKGMQHMDGDKALQFVRFRSYPQGDIERAHQQQRFFKALVEETLQPSSVTKLPKIAGSVIKSVDTNLGLKEMLTLAKAAKGLKDTEVVTQTLPGQFLDIDGISYWGVESADAHKAVVKLFDGQTSDVVQGQTIVQNTKPQPKEEPKTDWVPAEEDEQDKDQKNDPAKKPVEQQQPVKNGQNTTGQNTNNQQQPAPQQPNQPATGGNVVETPPVQWLPPGGAPEPQPQQPVENPNGLPY